MTTVPDADGVLLRTIAVVHNDLKQKFGLPRQSGLVPELCARIVFEPAYRDPQALRGLEGFSHLWVIWGFHLAQRAGWSPTVRPPRLGGNTRLGVFATRSPFRPNPLGLSCVKLEAVQALPGLGSTLLVSGCDMADGTPVYDIKPYLPYADLRPDAAGGFAGAQPEAGLRVVCPEALLLRLPEHSRKALPGLLAQDPRPAYQDDPERVYGFRYAGCEIRFQVRGNVLTVVDIG